MTITSFAEVGTDAPSLDVAKQWVDRVREVDDEIRRLTTFRDKLLKSLDPDPGFFVERSMHRCDDRCKHYRPQVGDRAVRTAMFGMGRPLMNVHFEPERIAGMQGRVFESVRERIYLNFGIYELVDVAYLAGGRFTQDRVSYFVKVEDAEWDEPGHRRAVSNLRQRAARKQIRVQAQDRDIRLIDPMNNIIHDGDVLTATAWVMGIDLDPPARVEA